MPRRTAIRIATYRVTPYIQGTMPANIKYELRNNNIWTNLSGTPITTNNSYTNEWIGKLSSPIAPYGWSIDYDRTDVKFTDQQPTITQLGSRDAALPRSIRNFGSTWTVVTRTTSFHSSTIEASSTA